MKHLGSAGGVNWTPEYGFPSPSDASANSNPIHTRKRIRLMRELQSDGSCRVNRMRHCLSIRCAFAFQSIETFFALLARFFGPKGNLDAKVMVVSMIGRASVDKVLPACPPVNPPRRNQVRCKIESHRVCIGTISIGAGAKMGLFESQGATGKSGKVQ